MSHINHTGYLRHRVKIQKTVEGTNPSNGMPVQTTQDVATVWAQVEGVNGREYYAAAAMNAENDKHVTIRYRTDVDQACTAVIDGVTHKIVSAYDETGARAWLTLICRSVSGG